MNLDGIIEDLPNKSTPLCKATFQKMCNAILNVAYPVGISVMFEDNEDHSNFLGFTWERNLVNQTPIGCDAKGSNIGETKGNETHTHISGIYEGNDAKESNKFYLGISNENGVEKMSDIYGTRFYGCTMDTFGATLAPDKTYGYQTLSSSSYQPSKVVAYWKRVA